MSPELSQARPWHARLRDAIQLPDVAALDRTFVDMARSMRPTIVTDIGSRDGEMAARCGHATQGAAQAFAFEANPENFFEFADAATREGVIFVPLAIGARRETVQMHVPDWASAQQNANRQFRGIGSTRSRIGEQRQLVYDAPAVTLEEFFCLPQHLEASFAHWIDVEGCAYEVLEGLGGLAARTMFFKIEVETREVWAGQRLVADCIDKCDELGFSPCAWFDHEEQFDIVFLNRSL